MNESRSKRLFDLIYALSRDIEAVARESGLNPDSTKWQLCKQVKEKFGSPRFVVFAIEGHDEVNKRISELRRTAANRSLQPAGSERIPVSNHE